VCHSGAHGQSRQCGLCYIVRVCEIQVLRVDACDATNGLDVGSRYNFYSELFELGGCHDPKRCVMAVTVLAKIIDEDYDCVIKFAESLSRFALR